MSEKKSYLKHLAEKNVRLDERDMFEYRKSIEIKTNVSKNADGSAFVKLGETQVIAGVKISVGEPFPDRPDEGTFIVNAEFAAIASPRFEPGPPGEDAIELARIIDRGIRSANAIDLKKLCIDSGKLVWIIFIDIYALNYDGNLVDASMLAAMAALKDARFPKLDGEKIVYGEKTDKKLPINSIPISCTFVRIGNAMIIDPNLKEEDASNCGLVVTCNENDEICALQKLGLEAINEDEVLKCVEIAIEKSKELRKYVG
ncbi:MAG: exosome complex protein Rrp42 [Candidatus Nanoarchaeia archaeon]|nr:exosome complex protein Rrp42 [Candidatus Jingweiarchaeum tengchongense]